MLHCSAMFKTGLLIVTRPLNQVKALIPSYLTEANRLVSKTLYVHFQPDFNFDKSNHTQNHKLLRSVPFTADTRQIVKEFYATSTKMCKKLDMRVLLGNFINSPCHVSKYELTNVCDLVMVDCVMQDTRKADFVSLIKSKFSLSQSVKVESLDIDENSKHEDGDDGEPKETEAKRLKLDVSETQPPKIQQHSNVALGGTFDRLHTGHKLLLSEGCLLATDSLTVGVTVGDMNNKKVLCELIEPVERRISLVRHFLEDVKPTIEYKLVPINNVYGPTITDPNLDLIVLSEETKKGGEVINTEREKKGMKRMAEYTIELLEDDLHNQYEETKISSSSLRKRLLGTLINPLKVSVKTSDRPYIIGLTGGIASGKSAICKRLEGLGAVTVDCDKLGHKAYVKGTPGFDKVVTEFGDAIIGEDGEVNRKELGKIVFADKKNLEKLNKLVWPEIAALAKQEIEQFSKAAHPVIVLEAAVLLEAGWESMTHEVWVTIIPEAEAIKRIMERNKLPEDQAKQRVQSQLSNAQRVNKSNVILSSLWEYEYTQSQVEKAWKLLRERIGLKDIVKSNM